MTLVSSVKHWYAPGSTVKQYIGPVHDKIILNILPMLKENARGYGKKDGNFICRRRLTVPNFHGGYAP